MIKHRNVNMLSGSITKGLLSMTVPIMIMNVSQVLIQTVDMAILKQFGAEAAVGAVGVSGNLITLCTALLIGLSAGANVVVAKRVGSGNREAADKAVMTALLLAVFGGLFMMVIGSVFAETFLRWMNCPESLLNEAVLYFRIYFYGLPILMLYNFSAAILRAIGDTKKPMFFLILGGIIKLVLTIVFVGTFHMSVDGVGYATVLSNLVAAILAFIDVLHSKESITVNFKKIRFSWPELKEMLFVGVPAGLQSAMYSFANVTIVSVVNSYGEAATTGMSIANQFDGILYQISYAPSLAIIPYVAQNIGAKNFKRARKSLLRATLITTVFGFSFGILSAIFSGQLSGLMSSSPEVIMYSRQKMVLVSSTYFICGINDVLGGALKGMGKPILPAVATMVYMCGLRFVWVYAIYPLLPDSLTYLYLVWPIGWILSIVTLLIAYVPAMKKLQRQQEAAA